MIGPTRACPFAAGGDRRGVLGRGPGVVTAATVALVTAGATAAADPPPAGEPSPEQPAPAPPAHTAASVAGAPRPGAETGRIDPVDQGDSTARVIGRGALFLPRKLFALVMAPARGAMWAYDRYDLENLYYRVFYNADRTIGLFPVATYTTGFGAAVGVRFEDLNVLGEQEHLAIQATTGALLGERYREEALLSVRTGNRISRWLELGLDANYTRRPADPFYGIGNGDKVRPTGTPIDPLTSDAAIETYYRYREAHAEVSADFHPHHLHHLHLIATGSLVELGFDRSTTGPPIDEIYDPMGLIGFEHGVRHAYGELEVRWDTRRSVLRWEPASVPAAGSLVDAFAGRVAGWGGSADYWRYGVELQHYFRLAKGPRLIATRLRVEGVTGARDQVAFAELPMLGGGDFLRGYPFERFRDRVAAFGSLQYQWDLSHFVDAYLFIDVGRVFPSLDDLSLHQLRAGYGIGLALHGNSGFLLEGNLATSIDGGIFASVAFNPILDARPRWR